MQLHGDGCYGGGVSQHKIHLKININPYYSILIFLLCIIALGDEFRLWVKINEERGNKLVLMHQTFL